MYITQHDLELFADLFMLLLCCGKLTADGFLFERVIQRDRDSSPFWIALFDANTSKAFGEKFALFDLYVVWCSNKRLSYLILSYLILACWLSIEIVEA